MNSASEIGMVVGGLLAIIGLAATTVGMFVLRFEHNALARRVESLEASRLRELEGRHAGPDGLPP